MSTNFDIPSYNPEADLQMAIRMIVKAFEKKTTSKEKEASEMYEKIREGEERIEELENMVKNYIREIKDLNDVNYKLKEENRYLVQITQQLDGENDKLQNFKNSILISLDSDSCSAKINKIQIAELTQRSRGSMASKGDKSRGNIENYPTHNNNDHISNSPSSRFIPISSDNSPIRDPPQVNDLLNKLNNKIYSTGIGNTGNSNKSFSNNEEEEEKKNRSFRFEKRISEMKSKLKSGILNNLNLSNNMSNNAQYSSRSLLSLPVSPRAKASEDKQIKSNLVFSSNNNNSDNLIRNYEGKSNQYILASKFFNECRITLHNEYYEDLVSILKERNENRIPEGEVYKRVEEILRPHQRLLKDFQNIFPM